MKHLSPNDTKRLKNLLVMAEQQADEKAIAAFLLARQVLTKQGLTFADLVRDKGAAPPLVCEKSYARLIKILTLSASNKEGETIAAFLMAKRLMQRLGLTFLSILDIQMDHTRRPDTTIPSLHETNLEVLALRKQVRALKMELAEKSAALQRYECAFAQLVDNTLTMHQEQSALVSRDPLPV